jgi:hypothetical protein
MPNFNRIVLFATAKNRPGFKDGDEFVREMQAMSKKFDDPIMTRCYKRAYWLRRKEFLEDLIPTESKTIALFCHGSKHWIYGIGYNRVNINLLADQLKDNCERATIILYACSCGKGKGKNYPVGSVPKKAGVAMMLSDALHKRGMKVKTIAHTTRGHATRNPNVVFIEKKNALSTDFIVKKTVVKRVSWWKGRKDKIGRKRWLIWIKMLRNDPTFRFDFPYMSIEEIHSILDNNV